MNKTIVKALALLIALIVLIPTSPAFAAGSQDADIRGRYVEGNETDVQAVDIQWGGLEFEYRAASQEWDTQNHEWKPTTEAKWVVASGSSSAIVLTNHSSVAIDVTLSATMNTGLGCEFRHNNELIPNNQFTVAKPTQGAGGAQSYTATVMPTGELSSENTEFVKIGSVTISIESEIVEPEMFTVTFKDWDGTVLKTEKVEKGKSATPPENPTREGYVFVKWDIPYDNVQSDLTVLAVYEQILGPTIYVEKIEATAGQTVTMNVYLTNNPGIAGAMFTIAYDSHLTLKDSASGAVMSGLTYTKPGQYVSPCNFSWDSESGMTTGDGIMLTLTFEVSSDVTPGQVLEIQCSYRTGDIYDENMNDVDFTVLPGAITIK